VQAQLAANRSKSQAYDQAGPVFPNGLYCEVVGTGSPGGASTLAKEPRAPLKGGLRLRHPTAATREAGDSRAPGFHGRAAHGHAGRA
jgi:hypothetical protein